MKVLMTADTLGGVFGYALELARALGRHGVSVALATKGAPVTREQRAAIEALDNVTHYGSAFKLEWQEDPWEDVARANAWLEALATEVEPDLIHLNDFAPGAVPFRVPALVVGHSCVLSWFAAVKGEKAPASWDRYRDVVTRGLRSADAIVAPTRAMLGALVEHYGPFANARAIPNGREAAEYPPAAKEPLVLAAGRLWDEAKNIVALERVRVSWPIRVAGEGTSRLEHLGKLAPDELARVMGRAAIYALPARYEPFGLSILEAALAGCALVLGDIPSLRETWEGAALFVPPGDDAAIGAAIEMLIRKDAQRHALAARARRRALSYTPERMALAYLALYRELLGEAP